jgi:hypothetical protein
MNKPIIACPDTCKFNWPAFHKQLDIALAHAIEEQDMLPNKTSMMEFLTYSFEKSKQINQPEESGK